MGGGFVNFPWQSVGSERWLTFKFRGWIRNGALRIPEDGWKWKNISSHPFKKKEIDDGVDGNTEYNVDVFFALSWFGDVKIIWTNPSSGFVPLIKKFSRSFFIYSPVEIIEAFRVTISVMGSTFSLKPTLRFHEAERCVLTYFFWAFLYRHLRGSHHL